MRVILHADLDCFYAQVEQVRLGIPEDKAVVVQQWQSLIAVNYPARAHGITRHMNITEAKQKCPDLVSVHTAAYQLPPASSSSSNDVVLRQFDPGNPPPASANHKVSLDAYRQASKSIFKLLRERFGSRTVEKASVDEAYLDVTEQVQERMDSEFPDWHQWNGDKVPADVELDWTDLGHPAVTAADNADAVSMQDVQIWIGALIARDLREEIKETLKYTCSIGIAPNKTLAKLASPRNKPDGQTYVTPTMVLPWMRTIPFDKIRFLGGKLGQQIMSTQKDDDDSDDSEREEEGEDWRKRTHASGVVYAGDLWGLSLEEMQSKVSGDAQLALWVYNLIRGQDDAPVKPRALTKTFLSAKNFRPPVTNEELLGRWMIVLTNELQHRLEEEAVDTRRWPRTITLSYRKVDMPAPRSKALEFPFPSQSSSAQKICALVLSRLIKPLLSESLFPLGFLGVSLGRFTEVGEDARGMATLDSFASAQQENRNIFECKPLFPPSTPTTSDAKVQKPKGKKAQTPTTSDISQFFKKKANDNSNEPENSSYVCQKCSKQMSNAPEIIQEHQDFHYAMQLAGLETS